MQKNELIWSRDMIKTLIRLVEQSPALWDVKCSDYKDKVKMADALKIIGESMNISPSQVKSKILKLRTQYSNEKNKMKKSKNAGERYKTKWEYFSSLNFMFHHGNTDKEHIYSVAKKTISPSQPTENIENFFVNPDIANYLEKNKIKLAATSEEPSNAKANKRSKVESAIDLEETAEILNHCLSIIKNSKPKDEFSVFGDYVASEMRLIKNVDLKQKLRRQIQRLFVNIADEDNQPSSLPSQIDENPSISTPLKKEKTMYDENNLVKLACKHLEEISNDDSVIAKGWGSQYSELTNHQKMLARKIISDVLFYGCLKNLNENTVREIQGILDMSSN